MKKTLLLLLFTLYCSTSYCGEVFIILFKGSAKSINANKTEPIPSYKKYRLMSSMSVEFEKPSVFIIYSTENKYLDRLKSTVGKIPYNTIVAQLTNIASPGFFKVIESYDELRETQANSKATVRLGTKGLNNKKDKLRELDEYLFPVDSAKILNSTAELKWKFKEKLLGGILTVSNAQTGAEILKKSVEETGAETIALPSEGWYNWEIISADENKTIESNSFKKLSAQESKREHTKLEEFKKSISEMLKETQDYLIEGYLEQNLLEN